MKQTSDSHEGDAHDDRGSKADVYRYLREKGIGGRSTAGPVSRLSPAERAAWSARMHAGRAAQRRLPLPTSQDRQAALGTPAGPPDDAREPVELPGGWTVRLTEQQRRVVELLWLGRDVQAAAREAGVHRTTVYRWLTRDPAFRAAHNDWERMADRLTVSRLRQGLSMAATTLVKAIAEGDVRAAAFMVRQFGPAVLPLIGPAHASLAEQTLEAEQKAERLDAEMRARRARQREDDDLVTDPMPSPYNS